MEEYNRDTAYRFYITRSLQLVPQGKNLVPTYFDILDPEKNKTETRSGDEIASDIITRAGLEFGE